MIDLMIAARDIIDNSNATIKKYDIAEIRESGKSYGARECYPRFLILTLNDSDKHIENSRYLTEPLRDQYNNITHARRFFVNYDNLFTQHQIDDVLSNDNITPLITINNIGEKT